MFSRTAVLPSFSHQLHSAIRNSGGSTGTRAADGGCGYGAASAPTPAPLLHLSLFHKRVIVVSAFTQSRKWPGLTT